MGCPKLDIPDKDFAALKVVHNSLKDSVNSSTGAYRFGFNGKEKDDEFNGSTGAVYDYGFRIYDARVAKFLSVDPLTKSYPMLTPYQFASNTPISAIDLDGLEAIVRITTNSTTGKGRPQIEIIRYNDTRLKHGPLGNGLLSISKNEKLTTYTYIGQENMFRHTVPTETFTAPPTKINDEGLFFIESCVKAGAYGEAKVSVFNMTVKLSGGAYYELLKTKMDKYGTMERRRVGDGKADIAYGPFKFEHNSTSGESTLEGKMLLSTKHNFATGDNSSTLNGGEDIDILGLGVGAGVGGDISLKMINSSKWMETAIWNYSLWQIKRLAEFGAETKQWGSEYIEKPLEEDKEGQVEEFLKTDNK